MTRQRKSALSWGARLVALVPYLWLALFFLVPFLIVLKISLSAPAIAQPPYTPVLDLRSGWQGLRAFFGALALDNYSLLASDLLYAASYFKSLEIAVVSTLFLLILGIPLAYDFFPHPHLRLDQHSPARRPAQSGPARVAHRG
jgi:putrescine transport system permease protein